MYKVCEAQSATISLVKVLVNMRHYRVIRLAETHHHCTPIQNPRDDDHDAS